jgi:hypothetical protein
MGLKQAGYPARDYSNHRPKIAVKLYEGNLTFSASGFGEDGRPTGRWDVTAPMYKGQLVKLHEDSNMTDIIVQPADDSSEAIGRLIIHNKLVFSEGWNDDEQNILPRENKEWGHYVPRGGTVEFFGAAIDELKLVDDNAAIAVGDYLDFDETPLFDKSTDATNWTALCKIEALNGGFIAALAQK